MPTSQPYKLPYEEFSIFDLLGLNNLSDSEKNTYVAGIMKHAVPMALEDMLKNGTITNAQADEFITQLTTNPATADVVFSKNHPEFNDYLNINISAIKASFLKNSIIKFHSYLENKMTAMKIEESGAMRQILEELNLFIDKLSHGIILRKPEIDRCNEYKLLFKFN